MKKIIELNEILHYADSRTVDKIAANYRSVDEKTSRRMYERCVSSIKNYSAEDGFSETFSAEPARKGNFFRIAGLTAVCAAAMGIFIYGLTNMKAPQPKPDTEQPVFFTETAVTTTVTSTDITGITTSKTEVSSAAAKTTSVSSNVTDSVSGTVTGTAGGNSADVTSAVQSVRTSAPSATQAKAESTAVQVTSQPENETDKRLAEVIARGKAASGTFVREEKIIRGEIPADTPRPSVLEIAVMAIKSFSYDEITEYISSAFSVPDFADNSGNITEYWLSSDGTDKIVINESEESITRMNGSREYILMGSPNIRDESVILKGMLYNMGIITLKKGYLWPSLRNDSYGYSDLGSYKFGYDTRMITSEEDLEALKAFNGATCPRAEMVLSGKLPESSHRLTLHEAEIFFSNCTSVNELVEEVSKVQYYPDLAIINGTENTIFYEIDTEGVESIPGYDKDIETMQLWITDNNTHGTSHDVTAVIKVNNQAGYLSDWFRYEHSDIDHQLWSDITNGLIK
ncbi:MAG TPA: hypothetical protein PLH98_20800 [Ruminococcus flavefaciens]|nr:hypothetical protein [Ruminococcus flavefaciens]HQM02946.1 hypothetical protein [Ruminococcus flavefaciens]